MTREDFIEKWGSTLSVDAQNEMEADLITVQDDAVEAFVDDQNEFHD